MQGPRQDTRERPAPGQIGGGEGGSEPRVKTEDLRRAGGCVPRTLPGYEGINL